MNRKKIAILLTGLVVTSSILTGCGSSSTNDKASRNDNTLVGQTDDFFKRTSEKTVREYGQSYLNNYPNNYVNDNVADAEVKSENKLDNKNTQVRNYTKDIKDPNISKDNSLNNKSKDIKNNAINEDSKINNTAPTEDIKNNQTSPFHDTNTIDNQISPSEDSVNEGTFNFNDSSNELTTKNPISGFSSAVNDQYDSESNSLNENFNSPINDNSTLENTDNVQNKQLDNNSNINNIDMSQKRGNRNSKISENNTSYGLVNDEPTLYKPVLDESKLAGKINVVKTIGGMEVTSPSKVAQGTAEVYFKLSGEILNINNASSTVGAIMQKAYDEAIKDANTGYNSTVPTTEREKLQAALVTVFTPSSTAKLIFRSLTDNSAKSIAFNATDMFPALSSNPDYVRKIVDVEATNQYSNSKAKSIVNPSDIVLKMIIRVASPSASEGLNTNNEYEFIGIKDDLNLTIAPNNIGSRKEITGFSIPNFKTDKRPSLLEAKTQSGSVIYKSGSATGQGAQQTTNFYLNDIVPTNYIDMRKLIINNKFTATGTSIKFPTIKLTDPDNTISKVELEDDRGNKYHANLVTADVLKPESGSYIEVTGLSRNTPYIFTKLHVTSMLGKKETLKTIAFANYVSSQSPKLAINDLPIRTTVFSGPSLQLGATHNSNVALPNKLQVSAVKNGMTSLRYIVKVANPEGLVGEVTVNGLRSGEESKVEKIVDEKTKENYYIITLSKLSKGTDYGFLIFETNYKDPEGNQLINRQALKDINASGTGITDNTTETTELTGVNAFNVIVNENNTSTSSRKINVPVFLDDLNNKFVRVEFTAPKDNPEAQVVYQNNELVFSNLKPESNSLCKVDFVYLTGDNKEEKISKYIRVTTAKVDELDIKSNTVIPKETEADVKFEFYSEPKATIKSVSVKDSTGREIKNSWQNDTKTLKLLDLTASTTYQDLVVTFTLDNNKTITENLNSFTTSTPIVKPTGKVADFVARVYKTALGREPEVQGWEYWIKKLESKEISASNFIAENLMTQDEFLDRELSKKSFINVMYSLIVNREAEPEGQAYWERKYNEYKSQVTSIEDLRIKIAREMMSQSEFKELVTSMNLKY